MAGVFFRLKLRLLRNGLRASGFRIAGFILGIFFGLQFSAFGFVLLAGHKAGREARTAIPIIVLLAVFIGWIVLPVFGFGIDETLDPDRLVLLPLRRRDLMVGLFVASSIGVAPASTLIALSGAIVGYGSVGPGVLVVLMAIVIEFALCIVAARAVTTALSRLLRSRRARDLSVIAFSVLGLMFALLGQLPRLIAGPRQLSPRLAALISRVLGWTPPGLLGRAIAHAGQGRPLIGLFELLPATLLAFLLALWWTTNLDRMATTAAATSAPTRPRRTGSLEPELFPAWARFLPRSRMGAVAAKELRYLWREPILRAQRISAGVLIGGTVVAVLVVPTLRRPEFVLAPAFLVWWFSVGALNQFAIDRSAYWMNVAAAGDPRDDLLGKNIALAIANVPLFTILAVVIAIVTKGWGYLPVAVANEAGLLAVMFAVGNVTSVRLAQPAPESPMNLWASRPGQGCGTAALMMVALLLNLLLIGPVAGLVAAGLKLWRPLLAVSVPISLAYGAILYLTGLRIASSWVRTHQAELLEELSPRRA